jgi:CHAT domain-containing protein
VQRLRRSLASPTSADFKAIGRELDEKVMRPVRALLGNTKTVLLSPEGLLNVVPFAALVDERGKFLVDSVELTYLTSGRDLLRLQQAPARAKSMTLIVANPAFGRPSEGKSPGEASRAAPLGGAVFQPLPGTAKEGKALRAIFGDGRAQLIVDSEATEDLLKRVEAPKILHIATHGFFLGDRTRAADGARALVLDASSPQSGAQAPPPEPRVSVENPLLRSGLALAGANGRKSGNDDGILTALEAASLDLRGTKLVVLSACETGLGDVQNGDGVYGMRRALVMAGAETQVASLWKVADEETRELMVSYYDKLNKGGGRSAALREVQLAMMARPATAHPYFWASFLVAGEAAPLPPEPEAAAQQKPVGAIPAGADGCACELAGRHKDGEGGPLSLAIGAAFAAIIAARRRSGHRSKGVH